MQVLVSAICPIRNEEENIQYIFNTLKPLSMPTEVLFVEGNSSDKTWEKAKALDNKKNKFGVFFRAMKQKGQGKAEAVATGFTNAKGKYLIIVDADLSIDQKNLEKVIFLFKKYGDTILATGNRLKGLKKPKAFYWINYVGNYFFRYYYSVILQTTILDISCGTKAITKDTWMKIRILRKKIGKLDKWGDIDWLFYSKKVGATITFATIDYKPRQFGQSKLQDVKTRWKFALNMFTIGLRILFLTFFK
ncbi:MAG TPA: glycosyltransferase family 2 protein [Patescibacteria group bacterium]